MNIPLKRPRLCSPAVLHSDVIGQLKSLSFQCDALALSVSARERHRARILKARPDVFEQRRLLNSINRIWPIGTETCRANGAGHVVPSPVSYRLAHLPKIYPCSRVAVSLA